MEQQTKPGQKRGLTAIDGALALIALLLIVQMWLLTATLESYLAGHREAVLPGAVISGVLFLISVALYLFVRRIDEEERERRGNVARVEPGGPERHQPARGTNGELGLG